MHKHCLTAAAFIFGALAGATPFLFPWGGAVPSVLALMLGYGAMLAIRDADIVDALPKGDAR